MIYGFFFLQKHCYSLRCEFVVFLEGFLNDLFILELGVDEDLFGC